MNRIMFDTLAIMKDGSYGNISQGHRVMFTDIPEEFIYQRLKEVLAKENLTYCRVQISPIQGTILKSKTS